MAEKHKLLGIGGPVKDNSWDITANPLTVGSGEKCRLRLSGAELEAQHLMVSVIDGFMILTPISGKTFLNGTEVKHAALKDGDEIKAGICLFRAQIKQTQHPASAGQDASHPAGTHAEHFIRKPMEQQLALSLRMMSAPDRREQESGKDRLFLLYQTARTLLETTTEEKILEEGLAALFGALDLRQGTILLYEDGKPQQLVSRISWKSGTGKCAYADSVAPSMTMMAAALANRAVCATADAACDSRFDAALSLRQAATHAAVCMPLAHGENVLGALYLDSDKIAAFSKEDLDFCELIAGNMAASLQNRRLEQRLKKEETLRHRLRRYLPEETVAAIISNPDNALPKGQSREITVLFSDFRGFTAASEQLEPHKVLDMLNAHFSVIVDIIFKHNGILDKYLGDGIMALFGLRGNGGNHALDAVKCALEMRQDLQTKLIERTRIADRPALPLGIGINTGKVVIGDIGSQNRSDYTAIGDTVNIASRLVSLAESGQILATTHTLNAVKEKVDSKDLGVVKLKGKSKEIQLYAIESLSETAKKA